MSERDVCEISDALRMCNASLREEVRRLKTDMRFCLNALQLCTSDKNMNVTTDSHIVRCINVIQQALAHDASKE